jgi:hypothetical protein
LANPILSPLLNRVPQSRQLTEDDIVDIHHRFMVVYGWIPVTEFRELPMATMWGLLEKVNEEYKEKKEMHQAILALAGVKR